MASRAYNFLKRGCGDRALTADDDPSLAQVTPPTKSKNVLDIIRDLAIADRAVGTASIGGATSELK